MRDAKIPSPSPRRAARLVPALGAVLALAAIAPDARARCIGDVDGDYVVRINELVRGVNSALGAGSRESVAAFDRNQSGAIEIAELITAVANALNGCPPSPTPTLTPSASATATITATATSSATSSPTVVPVERGRFERSVAFDAAIESIGLPYGEQSVTSAMSVDIDADGLLDVLIAVGQNGAHRETWLTRQTAAGVWQDAEAVANLGGPRAITDLDGDGYLDLIVADRLGVVFGKSSGLDLAAVENLPGADPFPQQRSYNSSITPIDLDGNGLTDLALAAFGGIDRILYQETDHTFSEQWLSPGLSFALCPVDFEDDSLPDLLWMTDGQFEAAINEGGSWRQTAPRSWVHDPPPNWPMDAYLAPREFFKGTPMACAWGNLDNDPDLELWLSQVSTGTPIYDRRETSWVDVGRKLRGIVDHPVNEAQGFEVFWGVAIVDFDGDGIDDIAVCGGNGQGYGDLGISHLGLFAGTANGFVEVGRDVGLGEGGDYQSLIADDIDADGHPDLLVGQFAGLPKLYLNRLNRNGGTVAVELRGPAAENLEVELVGTASAWTMRTGAQAQPLTGSRPVLFRGVGNERQITLRIHWPGGTTEMQVEPRPQPWVVHAPGIPTP